MARGRGLARLQVAPPEREALNRLVQRHTTAQAIALRARIVLGCAAGGPTPRCPGSWASPNRQSGSGGAGLSKTDSTGCSMSRGLEHLGASPTIRSRR